MLAHDSRSSARPARFDKGAQRHRALQAKVKVLSKQIALDDDDYRQILFDQTGKTSSRDCDVADLQAVVSRLIGLGAKPLPSKGKAKPASHPMAKKARALWISLYQLGVVRSPTEKSLEAFAKRQLGCERLAWAKQSHSGKLIEALKSMAREAGWNQTDANGNRLSVLTLKEGLCKAILARLVEIGEVPAHWTIDTAAFALCGIETGAGGPMSVEGYTDIAAALGAKLREAQARAGGAS